MGLRHNRGGGRPRDERIDARVLAAARQLLADGGLTAVTLDAVAEAAGASRSAIYRRWASADDLLLDALDEALGQRPGPDPAANADRFWADVRAGLDIAVAGLASPAEHGAIQFWIARLTHQPRLHRRYWERRVQPRRERAIQSLREAAARGEIAASEDADLLVDMLAGVLLYRYFLTPAELRAAEPDDVWLARLVDLGERLLAPPTRDPAS